MRYHILRVLWGKLTANVSEYRTRCSRTIKTWTSNYVNLSSFLHSKTLQRWKQDVHWMVYGAMYQSRIGKYDYWFNA